MSTYRQILFHFVFTTKDRKPAIAENHCTDLYKFIWGVVKNSKSILYQINGVEDHLHLLTDLPPDKSIADFIKTIKVSSSLWMKQSGKFPAFKGWQDGYGAFTLSIKEKDRLVHYIKNQKEHHKKESFINEYKRILVEHGVEFNETYLI